MASVDYFLGRKRYGRPQAMLFSNNPGTLKVINAGTPNEQRFYLPDGLEVGTERLNPSDPIADDFIILSDDNRSEIDFSIERIEKRERMVNGRMRSYHIADKLSINTSWSNLPSRAYKSYANFDPDTGKSYGYKQRGLGLGDQEFTTDGGAGGVELLKWYEDHPGSFWVFLSYDKYTSFDESPFNNLNKYSQVVEVFFSDFSYSVVKRGSSNHDFWNVSLSLEEV